MGKFNLNVLKVSILINYFLESVKFNKNSVVIDPFRYIKESEYTIDNNIKIINIGGSKWK